MKKAVPLVLRKKDEGNELDILAFVHPSAGKQIVKGTVESQESILDACIRELYEESGLEADSGIFLGEYSFNEYGQTWYFYIMEGWHTIDSSWAHQTSDDHGHVYQFFWQPLHEILDDQWHANFKRAVDWIKASLSQKYFIEAN